MKREHLHYYAIALGILVAGLAWAGVPINTMLVGLLVLACPLMMLFMMRGMHDNSDGHGGSEAHHDHGPDESQTPEQHPGSTRRTR